MLCQWHHQDAMWETIVQVCLSLTWDKDDWSKKLMQQLKVYKGERKGRWHLESHVTPHYNRINFRKAMVPFKVLLTSCVTGCRNFASTKTKIHATSLNNCLDVQKAIVSSTLLLASDGTDSSTDTKLPLKQSSKDH